MRYSNPMKIISEVVNTAKSSCFMQQPVNIICTLRLEEKMELEDELQLKILALKGETHNLRFISQIVKSFIKKPLYKLRIVINLVLLECNEHLFDACINACYICLAEGGIPLIDTFSSATAKVGDCFATVVYGIFTRRVPYMLCQGEGSKKGVIIEAQNLCISNSEYIKTHLSNFITNKTG